MPVIDAHAHLYPPEVNASPAAWAAARGEAHWATLCTRVRKSGRPVQGFPSVADLLRAMDAADVERVVLLGWYWEKPETCAWQNRFYAECLRLHDDRVSAFAALHPEAGLAAVREEISRAMDAGFSGVGELSPHSQGIPVDDPVLGEALAFAGELGLAVNFHVTEPDSKDYPGKIATPLADFARLARAYPETTFIWAHWGARAALDPGIGAEVRALNNVFFDTAASPLTYPPKIWREMADAVGAGRILFGTDFPLVLYPARETEPCMLSLADEARTSELDDDELAAILCGTARRVLGI
ncbi:amidohydrolase [Termitidicoccus mucosus]|uniref:amidohydrolase family protein n=1 Tax=Termitidicoccus mucosus TaxID=1184151 RepID=UPI000838969F